VVANNLSLIDSISIIYDKKASTTNTITGMVGLPVETLNTIQNLADIINTDDKFYNSTVRQLGNNEHILEVRNAIHDIILKCMGYDTTTVIDIKL
jgi:hypothetical protein